MEDDGAWAGGVSGSDDPGSRPPDPEAASSADRVPNSRAALVETLEVRRNLRRGLAVGVLTALLAVLVFVLVPPATERPTALYPLLAFVLATTAGALVATLLVANRARTLSKEF